MIVLQNHHKIGRINFTGGAGLNPDHMCKHQQTARRPMTAVGFRRPGCFSASLGRPTRTKETLPDIVSPPPFHAGVGLHPNSCALGARAPSKLSLGISGTTTHRAILFPLAAVSTHPAAGQPVSTRPPGSLLMVGMGRLSGAVGPEASG